MHEKVHGISGSLARLFDWGLCSAVTSEKIGSWDAVPIYDLSINVLPEAHRIEATGTIRLSHARQTRESFELILSSYMRDFRVDVLEPKVSAGPASIEKKETTGESIKWNIRPLR